MCSRYIPDAVSKALCDTQETPPTLKTVNSEWREEPAYPRFISSAFPLWGKPTQQEVLLRIWMFSDYCYRIQF